MMVGVTVRTEAVKTDAGRLDVHEDGPVDGSPVVLLHGFPQGAYCWDAVVPALTGAGYRTVAPDQRGYSPAARPRGRAAYTLSRAVSDAAAVIDERCGGRAHVVGHDWGAAVAWRLAARHPERVRTLTAVSVPPVPAYLRAVLTSRQVLASWYIAALQLPRLPERLLADPKRFAALLRLSGQSHERAERDARALADPDALRGAISWYRALAVQPPAQDPPVTVPTLFVWSDGDVAITRQAALHAGRHVEAPFRFVELRGVSHWIPDEAPAELAELIAGHLAAHPG
jgi:pimeloyl-ACP methyl ester carboxylesterase